MSKVLITAIFILECFALPVQYFLLLHDTEFTIFEATIRFFSYFTILTNSLVALCSFFLLTTADTGLKQFFSKSTTQTAITVYILIVGLVYNIILRPLAEFDGLHLVVSEIFHTIVPLLFLYFWIKFVPKQTLSYKWLPMWMIYPLVYVIYTLFHGIFSGFYPYPFIDAGKLGYAVATTNGVFVLVAFILLSAILIAFGKFRTKVNITDEGTS